MQLGAYSSDGAARAAWAALSARHRALLEGRTLHIDNALVHGTKLFRVQVRARTRAEAVGVCRQMTPSGDACFFVA